MKKTTNFKSRMLSVLTAAILLLGVIPVNEWLVDAEENTFVYDSTEQGTCETDDDGSYNLQFNAGWAGPTSNFKIDLLKGFKFNFTVFKKSHFQFGKTAGDMDSELVMWDDGGNLVCHNSNGQYSTYFGKTLEQSHYLNFRPVIDGDDITGYELYIDDKPLNGDGIVMTVDEFKECNNFNESANCFEGAYLNIYSEDSGTKLKLTVVTDDAASVPSENPFYPADGVSQNEDGSYHLHIPAWSSVKSTFRVNMLEGFIFNVSDLPSNGDWVAVGIGSDFWSIPTSAGGRSDLKQPVFLRNRDGKLFVLTDRDELMPLCSVSDNHTLSIKHIEKNGEEYYRLCIDGQGIGDEGARLTPEEFNKLNNYDAATDSYGGAYVRFGSNRTTDIKNIKAVSETVEHFYNATNFTSVNGSNKYEMTIAAWGSANSLWQVDLTKGFYFTVDELAENDGGDWLMLKFMEDYKIDDYKMENGPFMPYVNIKNTNGNLFACASDGAGGWCNKEFSSSATATHFMQAVPIYENGEIVCYRLRIDGKDFNGLFNISTDDFNRVNHYDAESGEFGGVYLRIEVSGGCKFSVMTDGAADFIGDYESSSNDNGKVNLNLKSNSDAVSTVSFDLTAGISFTLESLSSPISVRFAKNLWVISKSDEETADMIRPVIKLKDNGGILSASVSNGYGDESYKALEGLTVSGEHTVTAKKDTLDGNIIYRLYIDGAEINNSYYLTQEQFEVLNCYNASADAFSGAAVCFRSETDIKISSIYETVAFEGNNFSYSLIEDGHYNLNIDPWSYAYTKWKADLNAGIAFNVASSDDWIMFRFCNNSDSIYTDASQVSTYQPIIMLRQDNDGLYTAVMASGLMHRNSTKLKGVTLKGAHILSAKLTADEKTGLETYNFYLDGMQIVKGYTMSKNVFKKINNYNKENDTFDGTHILFNTSGSVKLTNLYGMTKNNNITIGDWEATANADIKKVNENTFNFDMKAFSSIGSARAVNFEKGLTFTLENPASDVQFGIGMSMLPGRIIIDSVPIVSDSKSLCFTFARNPDNTYNVISTTGLTGIWSGDLSGTHTYSMVKINVNGEEKYTLAIDGKAVFNDGLAKEDYIMLSNASRGSYPVIFTKNDLMIKNLTGEFLAKAEGGKDNLWDDDWSDDNSGKEDFNGDPEDGKDDDFEDDWNDSWGDSDDEPYADDDNTDGNNEPRYEKVLVGREKIKQEPIITYVTNWWFIIAIAVGVLLLAAGFFVFFPFKKKK